MKRIYEMKKRRGEKVVDLYKKHSLNDEKSKRYSKKGMSCWIHLDYIAVRYY